MSDAADGVIDGLVTVAGTLAPEDQAKLLRRLAQQLGTPSTGSGSATPGDATLGGASPATVNSANAATVQPIAYGGNGLQVQPGPVNPADYAELTYKITGCGYHVHRRLGSGHRESVYQAAMEEELQLAGLKVLPQRKYEVYDTPLGGHRLGLYIADLVVADKVIVELKALSRLDNSHLSQVICYLKVSGCPVGLLLNFGERSFHHRRIFPPKNIDQRPVEHQWLYKPDTAGP